MSSNTSLENMRLREYKRWYDNGQIQVQVFWLDEKIEGKYKHWYEDGRPLAQQFFEDGDKEGESRYWNSDGQLLIGQFYQSGQLIDPNFNRTKRNGFLQIKRCSKNQSDLFTQYLISDLTKTISNMK